MNESKEHIIIMASKLFLKKNYKEVTMRDVVEHTGLSKGAFYHYFESKEQLFYEVLNYFFSCMVRDYDSYSHDSFYKFYHDYIKDTIRLSNAYIDKFKNDKEDEKNSINYFALIFDALKLYPEYHDMVTKGFNEEIAIWSKRIATAKKKGEISSPLTDEEIAKIFMYLSDGVAMHMIMRGSTVDEMVKPFVNLWDRLYMQMKAL